MDDPPAGPTLYQITHHPLRGDLESTTEKRATRAWVNELHHRDLVPTGPPEITWRDKPDGYRTVHVTGPAVPYKYGNT